MPTISMIRRLIGSFIALTPQKLGQLHLHHFTEILPDPFSNIVANQIEQMLRLRLNFFE